MSTSPRHANRSAAYRFWRRWLAPAVLAAAVSAAGGAHAEDSVLTWIVKSISSNEEGDIIQASAMQVPQIGTALVTGQRISTGAGQNMVLVNGRDLVEIRPNSTVTIGDDDASTAGANVDLINGTIHVEVGKRAPGKTFSIEASYLVATVKGTQFDVSSSSAQSAVSVTEGTVAVAASASGTSVDVTVGNTAIVRRNADKPMLAPTHAGSTPNSIEVDKNIESASTDNSSGSDSGGSNSGGSNTGGSSSGSGGIGGAVGDATGAVGGTVGGATDAVGGAVSGATGAVGGAVGGPVGDAVSGVGDAVGGAVSGVGGAVGGAVGGLGGALGGLLGGGR
jgi:FecR protein